MTMPIDIEGFELLTFVDAVNQGEATLDQVNDWIEKWRTVHTPNLELYEVLGMAHDEYLSWLNQELTLDQIIREH
jgi:hypothetical protein